MGVSMTNYTWSALWQDWNDALIKVLGQLPQWVLQRQKPVDEPQKRRDPLTKIIIGLIVCLSAASVTNLSHRAFEHHADWNSFLVGGGIAVGVPLAIFIAITVEHWYVKGAVWLIAVAFAVTSGLIQYQVYLPVGAEIRFDQKAEAAAFGFGVPLAECLFAAMEAVLLAQALRKRATDEAQAEAHTQALAAQVQADKEAEAARQLAKQQREDDRVFGLQKRAIELENLRAQQAQKLELERLQMEAKLAAKLSKPVSNPVSKSNSVTPIGHRNGQEKPQDSDSELDTLLDMYLDNPSMSRREVGRKMKRSPSTITNWLHDLEAKEIVHLNGNNQVQVLKRGNQ